MIALEGWQVPGYETKVRCGFKLAGEDLSGAGSFLITTDNGVKASVLSVTTKVAFIDKDLLTELITKSKQLGKNGERLLHTVNCDIAEVFKVRKVKFDGEIKAVEDEQVKAWNVSFNLLEVLSKSEREQQQIDSNAAKNVETQANDGHNSVQEQFENAKGP